VSRGPVSASSPRRRPRRAGPPAAARLLGLLACAGLLISLFCPWLSQTAISHGLHGSLRLRQTMSGWQALSVTAAVTLVVSLLVPVLWALPRLPQRRRGAIAAGGATLAALALIWTIAAHEGSRTVGPARIHDGIGWGVVLALVCALALLAAGLWTARTPRRTGASAGRRPRRAAAGPRTGDEPAGAPWERLGAEPTWDAPEPALRTSRRSAAPRTTRSRSR
jgi:hypothetical protein